MKELKNYFIGFILIALIVGVIGGVAGALVLKPYLVKTDWGNNFLNESVSQLVGEKKIYEVKEESATIDVVRKVSPSVVSVVVTKELSNFYNMTGPDIFGFPFRFSQPQQDRGTQKQEVGGGTGFVIAADGLILTNKHVVADEKAEYSVVFNDGKKYEAKVLGRDPINDIAVLKIEAKDLPVIELGDSDQLESGQTVIAIGNALAEYKNTVTRGVISGINRRIVAGDGYGSSEVLEEVLQTDAAINPGNSGGPLLNLAGQVIGINTAVNNGGQSIAFAIPVNQAKNVIESVKEFGRIVRPWLGVRYVALNKDVAQKNSLKYEYGALIQRGAQPADLAIVPGSPADKAGLLENDIILSVNGVKLENDKNLAKEVSRYKPGEEISLMIFRKDGEKTVKVKLEERTQ
jgi:S1-C subfamily serine protease